eukprot:IDg4769t1
MDHSDVTKSHSNYIFEVENLISEKKDGRRLKFFCNSDFEVTEELRNYLSYQSDKLFIIARLDDFRKRNGVPQVLIKWKDFGIEERNWVDVSILRENIPNMLKEFLEGMVETGTARQRKFANSI